MTNKQATAEEKKAEEKKKIEEAKKKEKQLEARRLERDQALIDINDKPLVEQKSVYMEYLDTYDERSQEAIKRKFNHLQ